MAKDRTFDSNQESETPKVQAWNSESAASSAGVPQSYEKLSIARNFSDPELHPFEQLEWETRSVAITGDNGEAIFEQKNVEVPVSWSQLATKVVVSKYFYGDVEGSERESSIKQLVHSLKCKFINNIE